MNGKKQLRKHKRAGFDSSIDGEGRTALKEVFESKEKAIELFLLSIVSVDVVLLLIKIYLMIKQLPLSTEY